MNALWETPRASAAGLHCILPEVNNELVSTSQSSMMQMIVSLALIAALFQHSKCPGWLQ